MGGAVFERALQFQHHLAGAVTLEPFVGYRRAEALGFEAVASSPETATQELRAYSAKWAQLVKERNIKVAERPDCRGALKRGM